MPTSRTQKTPPSSTDQQIPADEIAYYNRRFQNLVFDAVIRAFANEAKEGRISRAALAKKIGKRPEQITRWLSGPANWTLDTISTIVIGMGAEMKPPEIEFLRDRPTKNYVPDLVDFLESMSSIQDKAESHIGFASARPTETSSPNTGEFSDTFNAH